MTTVGERIKKRRQELHMTVDELADRLNKNRATIYRYESDEIENMPTTVLEPLARVLKTTPAVLMGWVEDDNLYFSKNFEFLMHLRGVDLKIIEKETDIKYERLCSLINELGDPSMKELKALANYFGVSNSDMLTEPLYLHNKMPINLNLQESYELLNNLNGEGIKKVNEYIKDLSDKYRK